MGVDIKANRDRKARIEIGGDGEISVICSIVNLIEVKAKGDGELRETK